MSDGKITPFPKEKLFRHRLTIEELRGRLGHFTVSDESLKCWPDLVLQVMGRCIVLRAGRCQHGSTVYLALSEDFDRIAEDEQPPMYEWYFEGGRMHARRLRPPQGQQA